MCTKCSLYKVNDLLIKYFLLLEVHFYLSFILRKSNARIFTLTCIACDMFQAGFVLILPKNVLKGTLNPVQKQTKKTHSTGSVKLI